MKITCADGIATRIKRAQETDEEILAIKDIVKERTYKGYSLKDEILYKIMDGHEVIVLPKQMKTEIKEVPRRWQLFFQKTADIITQNYHLSNLSLLKSFRVVYHVLYLTGKEESNKDFCIHKERNTVTYTIGHLGPLVSTSKNYKRMMVIFWLYPTKSTTSKEVIGKLELQKFNFGNLSVIISDRGTAFTSQESEDYRKDENIQ